MLITEFVRKTQFAEHNVMFWGIYYLKQQKWLFLMNIFIYVFPLYESLLYMQIEL